MIEKFPETRMRRSRKSPWIRDILAETQLAPANLILPIFIHENSDRPEVIDSMPGVLRYTCKGAVEFALKADRLGIKAINLFPYVAQAKKSEDAAEAVARNNLVCRAIDEIKAKVPDIGIIADVALDPYTSHGHDGILEGGVVANDASIELLIEQAINYAEAGADIVAPSDMMDGRIAAIRKALEEDNFPEVGILSYAAKYASHFYSPFRDAIGSRQNLGRADKRTYQMDYRNRREATREARLDIQEGADYLLVKPAMLYLDIIADLSRTFDHPVFAYQVSGEYSMIKAASKAGYLEEEKAFLEAMVAIRRAGASCILSYYALELCQILEENL